MRNALIALCLFALTASQVAAHFAAAKFDPATLYWSGTGEWNTTNTNWGDQSGVHSGSAWSVGVNDAVFEGTGGTVTIAGHVTRLQLADPPMTTVDQSVQDLGHAAMEILIDLIRHPERARESDPIHVTLPTELVVRRSCGPPPPPD